MQPTAAPLLTTKFYATGREERLVRRDRLMRTLDATLKRRLTLVSAPAGFGKSTLIGSWTNEAGVPTAWISLEEKDNDPIRFLRYVVTALDTAVPEFSSEIPTLLESSTPPSIDPLLGLLVNDLSRLGRDVVLVLDDAHTAIGNEIYRSILFLLEHAPREFHLIIATRVDPPIPLSRLRANGDLLEIRASQLRFLPEESTDLFNSMMGLDISEVNIAALQTKTEGWIAGLKMAGLSLQNQENIDDFVSAFTGADRYVLDYLLEEVLSNLGPEVTQVMLEISILDRFNGSLVEAVTGHPNGGDLLADLERRNLFMVALDDRREWYRYHHLFSELLHHRLHRTGRARLPGLHRRAGEWFEATGNLNEARSHILLSHDRERLAQLMNDHWYTILNSWSDSDLEPLELLDESTLRDNPRLAILRASALFRQRRYTDALSFVDALEGAIERRRGEPIPERLTAPYAEQLTIEDRELLGAGSIIRTAALRESGAIRQAILHGERALLFLPDRMPSDPRYHWSQSHPATIALLGNAYQYAGRFTEAMHYFDEALRRSRQRGDGPSEIRILVNIISCATRSGQLAKAEAHCHELLAMHDRVTRLMPHLVAIPHQMLALVHTERHEIDQAIEHGYRAIELNELLPTQSDFFQQIEVYRITVSALELAQRYDEADIILKKLEAISIPAAFAPLRSVVTATRALLELRQGRMEAARTWSLQYHHADRQERKSIGERFVEASTWARLLLAEGKPDEAMVTLDTLAEMLKAEPAFMLDLVTTTLRAAASEMQDEIDRGLQLLDEALTIAAGERFIRPFVIHPEPIARLLLRYLQRPNPDLPAEWLERLCLACGVMRDGTVRAWRHPRSETATTESPALREPLTSREREILELLARGYTNRKIAERLYLSVNTIKTHVANLYDKLGVANRTEAVARALDEKMIFDAE